MQNRPGLAHILSFMHHRPPFVFRARISHQLAAQSPRCELKFALLNDVDDDDDGILG